MQCEAVHPNEKLQCQCEGPHVEHACSTGMGKTRRFIVWKNADYSPAPSHKNVTGKSIRDAAQDTREAAQARREARVAPLDIDVAPLVRKDEEHITSVMAQGHPSQLGRRTGQRFLLAQAFYERGPLTDEEAAEAANITKGTPWCRCTDLRQGGWIEWTGELRATRCGTQAKVWRMTEAARSVWESQYQMSNKGD